MMSCLTPAEVDLTPTMARLLPPKWHGLVRCLGEALDQAAVIDAAVAVMPYSVVGDTVSLSLLQRMQGAGTSVCGNNIAVTVTLSRWRCMVL
jgi:hypothetical protein